MARKATKSTVISGRNMTFSTGETKNVSLIATFALPDRGSLWWQSSSFQFSLNLALFSEVLHFYQYFLLFLAFRGWFCSSAPVSSV